jgi:hypothetical protein
MRFILTVTGETLFRKIIVDFVDSDTWKRKLDTNNTIVPSVIDIIGHIFQTGATDVAMQDSISFMLYDYIIEALLFKGMRWGIDTYLETCLELLFAPSFASTNQQRYLKASVQQIAMFKAMNPFQRLIFKNMLSLSFSENKFSAVSSDECQERVNEMIVRIEGQYLTKVAKELVFIMSAPELIDLQTACLLVPSRLNGDQNTSTYRNIKKATAIQHMLSENIFGSASTVLVSQDLRLRKNNNFEESSHYGGK